jgi:hypothetical protein
VLEKGVGKVEQRFKFFSIRLLLPRLAPGEGKDRDDESDRHALLRSS